MKKLFGILGLVIVMALTSPTVFAKDKVSVKQTVKVNINTASVSELKSIKGIGEKKAQSIVDFRKANGKFKKTEDIMLVKGIGEKMFAKIKDKITI
jgi:competence protein ComEA